MDTKTRPHICCLQETHLKNKGHIQTESEGLEKDISSNRDQKKAGVAILISDKIDFEIKTMKRDKEGHYIMIKGSIQEEAITFINIYAPNIGAPQYVRHMLTSQRRQWHPTPVLLPGKSHGRRSLVCCSPWGR